MLRVVHRSLRLKTSPCLAPHQDCEALCNEILVPTTDRIVKKFKTKKPKFIRYNHIEVQI